MNERQRNIIVGLTTLAGVVGLVVLLMLFGYLPALLKQGYEIHIDLPHAGGLHEGSRVKFAGIDVGAVERVQLKQAPDVGVAVMARIRPEVVIPQGVSVEVISPFLGGSASVDLSVDAPLEQPVQPLPTDGTARLEGQIPDLATAVAQEIHAAIERPMASLDRFSAQFETLSAEWEKVGRNINNLIEIRDLARVDGGEAQGNLATVLARTDMRLAELEQVLAGIDAYVNDEALRADVRQTAANARELTGTVAGSVEALRTKYVAVADRLAAAIDSMKVAVEQVSQSDGTFGKMLSDPALYDNLNDASVRMQKAIDEVRLLVQKWKAEGLPVDLF